MEREEILLREYDSCRQLNSTFDQRFWIMMSFFQTINIGLFGWIATGLVTAQKPLDCLFGSMILIVAITMIFIVRSYYRYHHRIDFSIQMNYERMREIETQLGMWQSRRIEAVDAWDENKKTFGEKINEEEQKHLLAYHDSKWWHDKQTDERWKYTTHVGSALVRCLFFSLFLFWILIIVAVIVLFIVGYSF